MAEIKNNFLGSKMNRDVDDRLLPPNEYREAYNLQINTSEGSDSGTLQNVFGNQLIPEADFNALESLPDGALTCIGTLVDNAKDNIYIFLTNHTDSEFLPEYNPSAKNFIYVYNTKSNYSTKLVGGPFLNFSTKSPITGVNILEDLLFFTDNRNQPRKINVSKALNNPGHYTTEDQISVAKISPLYPINLYKQRPQGRGDGFLAPGAWETTMYDVQSAQYPDGTNDTAHFQLNYPGDPSYLESRMVRFSYRYKFEDGEYSIFAPFTQIAYIPKQDGYFLNSDEDEAFRSTIVKFMQNKVNNILLQIVLPCEANLLSSKLKIVEIDILYKESDSLAVSVIDSIPATTIATKSGSSYTYEYNYQSKKPFKTLPERDLIRVYDKVPLKALAQEVVSNRVVYSNYQDKASYPKYLNYNVGYGSKYNFGFDNAEGTSIIEYPNHTVKQNRNYQVGVILSDRFGRQSGVILSDSFPAANYSGFGASSLHVPYFDDDTNKKDWPGLSLKILFNNPIPSSPPDRNTGWPGLYNGDPNSAGYNPTGWYSYKIVVKQTEQEYYNVYLPGVMNAYPEDTGKEVNKTAHAVLINDNINKVPRDLKEVGPTQTQFRSSVELYSRVNNVAGRNAQAYPGNRYSFVNTIATNASLFSVDPANLQAVYDRFYQIKSNPLIARISTGMISGVTSDVHHRYLAVYETKPVESRLDIYWETSTVGLIDELNEAILTEGGGAIDTIGWNWSLSEDDPTNTFAVNNFSFIDIAGSPVFPTSMPLMTVRNLANESRDSKFTLEAGSSPGAYRIKTTNNFYYGPGAAQLESYVFYFTVTSGSSNIVTSLTESGSLQNVVPTITSTDLMIEYASPVSDVYQFTAVNGSAPQGGKSTFDLTWTIVSQESMVNNTWYPTTIFSIVTSPATPNGMLREVNQIAVGMYRVKVRVTDAGGMYDEHTITINYLPAVTYNCVPLQGGCQVVVGGGGQYTSLSACQSACTTCNSYTLTCGSSSGLQCEARYRNCTTNAEQIIQFTSPGPATITCAKTGSVYSTGSPISVTQGQYCYS